MRREKTTFGLLRALLLPCGAVLALLIFASALSGLDSGQAEEGARQLESALRRGCVACYAAEGIYPPDLDYLAEHYGVIIDEELYTVFYDVFANNLMPDITVLEN